MDVFRLLDEMHLQQVEIALTAIDAGVADCAVRVVELEARSDESADAQLDDQLQVVETLVGCAFVLCQTHITLVVSHILRRRKRIDPGVAPKAIKTELLKLGSCIEQVRGITHIQAIDALANYFKHRDEWNTNWEKLSGGSAVTRDLVRKIGLEQCSSGNLRTGAEVLGCQDLRTNRLAKLLGKWRERVQEIEEARNATRTISKKATLD